MNPLPPSAGLLVAIAFSITATTTPALPAPTASPVFQTVGYQSRNAAPERNPEGIPWSAVDVTMGIGPVPKTLPSAPDKNVAGIPLTVVDRLLG